MNLNETSRDLDLTSGFKISAIIFLTLELILGVVSSTTVLLIYWNKRHIRNVASKFIANLAVIDFAICCVCIPLTIVRLARFPRVSALLCLCHEASSSGLRNSSFATLLLICYDRYKSITSPFVLRLNHRSAKRVLILAWFLTIPSFVLPFIEWTKTENLRPSACIALFCKSQRPFYLRLYYLPLFLCGCTILLPAYLRISRAALSRVHIQSLMVRTSVVVPACNAQRWNPSTVRQREFKIAKMTGAVVCSICLLWLPYTALTFTAYFVKPSNLVAHLEFVFLALGYFNCVLNPLLYAFTQEKFRTAFFRIYRVTKNKQGTKN
ncbi:G-protein coupled receptor 22-like [Montipora foliosa]|uniref:G-protein coupled receptor 22-like n=1 Tax=Montipora foliosa TaxID=591990 RepID=UPI0035F1E637